MVLALEATGLNGGTEIARPGPASGLRDFIAQSLGRDDVRILSCTRLEGGAVQENWRIVVSLGENEGSGDSTAAQTERYVLRTSAKTGLPDSRPKAEEFALLRTAWNAGVLVPEPLWLCTAPEVIGADFFLCRDVPGTAQGQQIMALNQPETGNPTLLEDLGLQLAKIHAINVLPAELSFLQHAHGNPAENAVRHWRQELAELAENRPALEWGLQWCEAHLPAAPDQPCLLHGDFRTGNYLVDAEAAPAGCLQAILDWEFAQWGDPMSDIGWFCAACWRFDRPDLEAGGIGTRSLFYRAYEQASGREVNSESVRFWEVLAHIRWAVIACQQGQRFFEGGESSLDLGLTGRLRPAQIERHLLEMIAPEVPSSPQVPPKRRDFVADITPNAVQVQSAHALEVLAEAQEIEATARLLASAATLFQDEIVPSLASEQLENGRMIRDALECVLSDLQQKQTPVGQADKDSDTARVSLVATDSQAAPQLDLLTKISRALDAEKSPQ